MKTTRLDTCEHLLAVGQTLCNQRGFNGMGLIELLKVAQVPKGSFYHYFSSKEAFGTAMLERYFSDCHQRMYSALKDDGGNQRNCILNYYRQLLDIACNDSNFSGCLAVKLSAEVCDLSEPMRLTLEAGSAMLINTLSNALEHAQTDGSLRLSISAHIVAQTIYTLWLGASLQSKIAKSPGPLENALRHIDFMLSEPH